MTIPYNIDDIFQMAEQIERNGAEFYRRAAEHVDEGSVKELLTTLAGVEVKHEQTFKGMHARLAGAAPGVAFDIDEQAARYLAACVSGTVFDTHVDLDALFARIEGPMDILRMAIGFEKDSIVYYLGLKHAVPPELGRDEVDAIIEQEMGHINFITQEMAQRL